jgi:hypothetical protein
VSVRRSAPLAAVVLALVAAGCGGAETATQSKQDGDVSAQEAARTLLAQLDGGGCDCTGAARAQARIDDGLAVAPAGSVTVGGGER